MTIPKYVYFYNNNDYQLKASSPCYLNFISSFVQLIICKESCCSSIVSHPEVRDNSHHISLRERKQNVASCLWWEWMKDGKWKILVCFSLSLSLASQNYSHNWHCHQFAHNFDVLILCLQPIFYPSLKVGVAQIVIELNMRFR